MKKILVLTLILVFAFMQTAIYAAWNTLGANVNKSNGTTTFSIWSPDNANVLVYVEKTPGSGSFTAYALSKVPDFTDSYGYQYTNIYSVTAPANLNLCRYHFYINGQSVRDPYARMVVDNQTITNQDGYNHGFSVNPYDIVIDTTCLMQPSDFSPIVNPHYINKTDAIVYETHVVDYTYNSAIAKSKVVFNPKFTQYLNVQNTINDSYVSPYTGSHGLQSTFLAMAQTGTTYADSSTGLDNIVELGATHVHIMPFANFSFCGSRYDFGYDPMDYNVPQVNYSAVIQPSDNTPSTYPNYIGRIIEVQQMIDNFHKKGIRVLMDAVYNHTVTYDVFSNITTQYYNYTITQYAMLNHYNAMVNNFVRDSMEYWVRIYNIDGFRVDMMQVDPPNIPPSDNTPRPMPGSYIFLQDWMWFLYAYMGKDILVFGEYFNTPNNNPDYETGLGVISCGEPTIGNNLKTGAGGFGWPYKQSLIGNPMDTYPSYGYLFNTLNGQDATMQHVAQGSRGSIRATFSPENTPTDPIPKLSDLGDPMFANFPGESINYIDCHDGYCTWDAIRAWAINSGAPLSYQTQIDEFGFAILMTSQGISYFYEGDEFLRSKNSDVTKASSSDFHLTYNTIDWSLKGNNSAIFNFYKKVSGIRLNHPVFRLPTWNAINSYVQTYYYPQNQMQDKVVVTILDGTNVQGETWPTTIVVYNSGNDYTYTIPNTWGSNKQFKIALDIHDVNPNDNPNTKPVYNVGDNIVCGGTAVTVFYSIN